MLQATGYRQVLGQALPLLKKYLKNRKIREETEYKTFTKHTGKVSVVIQEKIVHLRVEMF
jgi:hypothetical protein